MMAETKMAAAIDTQTGHQEPITAFCKYKNQSSDPAAAASNKLVSMVKFGIRLDRRCDIIAVIKKATPKISNL